MNQESPTKLRSYQACLSQGSIPTLNPDDDREKP